jgi:branched-chain amino acid transport system substrate-binding protein
MEAGGIQDSEMSSTLSSMWSSLQLFATANSKLGDNPTAAETLANMFTIKGETLGGLIPPITFTTGQPAAARNCFWPIKFENKNLTAPLGGLKFECYPAQK